MQESMERQASAERERRAIETTAQIALADASSKAIEMISEKIADKELPAMFLLGDRYINSLEKMGQSENYKIVVYPADLQALIKRMLGKFGK